MKQIILTAAAVVLGLAATTSRAVVLDFDAAASAPPYAEDGFAVTSFGSVNFGGCAPPCANNGTTNVFVGSSGSGVDITDSGGGVFSLLAFDIGELFQGYPAFWSTDIQVTGFLSGGGTVASHFFLDGSHDGPGGGNDMQTFAPTGFTNLTSLRFASLAGGGFTLDNVNLLRGATAVPEPTTLALVAGGLLFGLARRRRRAS